MDYKRLFIWVEGEDDERFFSTIIKPIFEEKYNWVQIIPYSQMPKEKVDDYINSIKSIPSDYIFVADKNLELCLPRKKQKLQEDYKKIDEDRILLVIIEIEGWYLAGLDDTSSRELKIPPFSTTEDITKEKFNALIPQKFLPRRNFMRLILDDYFQLEIAKNKNSSFNYILEKYDC